MASLAIAWEYLTGYAVATDSSTRDRAEWPPHPARVFMALAAAWFETEPAATGGEDRDDWTDEGVALRWLETLGDPEMLLPEVEPCYERSKVTCYVPVNDKAGPSAATLQSCPAITRSKQPRLLSANLGGEHVMLPTLVERRRRGDAPRDPGSTLPQGHPPGAFILTGLDAGGRRRRPHAGEWSPLRHRGTPGGNAGAFVLPRNARNALRAVWR